MEEVVRIAEELEKENSARIAQDPLVQESLKVVEKFLRTHKVLCYGGTAINNLLPPEDRFYDPKTEIPDYDFFSRTPQEHAVFVANNLKDIGIKNIEVKPGVHLGTFKVFADFEGVADITYLEPEIFDRLWDENVVVDGIHYVSPDFLRMSMYLELSRPRGDVSRWKKVYERLLLLNKHYPIKCMVDKDVDGPELDAEHRKTLRKMLLEEPVVLLGASAYEVHMRKEISTPAILLAEKETIERLTAGKKVEFKEGNEILPPIHSVIEDDGSVHFNFYETTACHSYHSIPGGGKVASIPTILQFFFAYIYSAKNTKDTIGNMLCVAQRLVDLASHKPKRRFDILTPKDCIGIQETKVDMRKNKAVLYEKLSTNKNSPDFVRYFFTYDPHDDEKERKKARERLRKTRRARTGM
jgi:hypothetical protein